MGLFHPYGDHVQAIVHVLTDDIPIFGVDILSKRCRLDNTLSSGANEKVPVISDETFRAVIRTLQEESHIQNDRECRFSAVTSTPAASVRYLLFSMMPNNHSGYESQRHLIVMYESVLQKTWFLFAKELGLERSPDSAWSPWENGGPRILVDFTVARVNL
jgi:hypothetical protein